MTSTAPFPALKSNHSTHALTQSNSTPQFLPIFPSNQPSTVSFSSSFSDIFNFDAQSRQKTALTALGIPTQISSLLIQHFL